jgi:ABC-2 type transport system permease protein
VKNFRRIYAALLLASFQANTQYRIQSLLWLLFAIIRPVVFLAAWSAAAATQGGEIGGYTISDFAAYYVCITLVGLLTLSWNVYDFELEVRQGKLAPKLLRPLHPLHYAVVDNIVYKINVLPALAPVLVIIAVTFQAHFDTQWWPGVLVFPSVVLAACLQFFLGWAIASFAFWTTRLHAIVRVYDRLSFLFAGQIAPLSLLPGPLAVLGYLLPFAYTLWVPAEILRGGVTADQALVMVAGQVLWLVLAWVMFVVIWHYGLRQFSAVGA